MQTRSGALLHFGKTIIVTGPSRESVDQCMRRIDEKSHGAILALASPYGKGFRGRALTGADIKRFFTVLRIPFKGARDKQRHAQNIQAAWDQIPREYMKHSCVLGYALTQEAMGKARYINLKA